MCSRAARFGVALWSGEEQGEFGSLGYVDQHLATVGYATTPEELAVPTFLRTITGPITPKPDYALFSGYFNIDNGGGKLLGIYADGNAAIVPIFQQWIAPLKDLGVTTVTMRPSGSSDQDSFDNVGLPGFQFIQDPRDYETRSVHTNQDTYERLSPEDLKQAAVVEAIFLYDAAMRDQMLPRNPFPHPELEKKPESRSHARCREEVGRRASRSGTLLRFTQQPEMISSPHADGLQYRRQRHSIFRDRVAHTRRHGLLLPADQDAVLHQLLQVPDQHPLRNFRDAATQLAGAHRPV